MVCTNWKSMWFEQIDVHHRPWGICTVVFLTKIFCVVIGKQKWYCHYSKLANFAVFTFYHCMFMLWYWFLPIQHCISKGYKHMHHVAPFLGAPKKFTECYGFTACEIITKLKTSTILLSLRLSYVQYRQ